MKLPWPEQLMILALIVVGVAYTLGIALMFWE